LHNKSLHWIFTPLRSVKTSEFKRYTERNSLNSENMIKIEINRLEHEILCSK